MSTLYRERGAYTVAGFHAGGRRWRVRTGMTDKTAAREVEHKLQRLSEFNASHRLPDEPLRRWIDTMPDELRQRVAKAGLLEDRHRRLAELVADFRQHLADRGNTAEHVSKTVGRIERVIDGIPCRKLADLTAAALQRYLADLRTPRPEPADDDQAQAADANDEAKQPKRRAVNRAGANRYLRACRQFTRWLVREQVLATDPLAHLSAIDERAERVGRRALEVDELRRIIAAAETDGRQFGVDGPDRALLYRVAAETGLRASELRSLTRSSFVLTPEAASVTVLAAHAKARREDTLPLREALRQVCVASMSHLLPDAPALRLPTPFNMAKMIRADARRARLAWLDEAATPQERERRDASTFLAESDGAGRRLDCHTLRHTCGSWLASAGVHPKLIQRIMRHSTISLTMDRYTHAFAADEAAAVAALPDLGATAGQRERATGTDDAKAWEQYGERAARKEPQTVARFGKIAEAEQVQETPCAEGENRDFAGEKGNGDDWTRTSDPGLMNPLLYQLSYVAGGAPHCRK